MLAWAITVHKSQGQSIERLHVDLSRTFEYGQGRYPQLHGLLRRCLFPPSAYVALSRATKLETLEVRGFDPFKYVIKLTLSNQLTEYPF